MNASCTASSAALRSCRTKSANRSIEGAFARSTCSKPAGWLARASRSSSMPANLIEFETRRNSLVGGRGLSGACRQGLRGCDRPVADLRPDLEHLVDQVLGHDAARGTEAGGIVQEGKDLLADAELAALEALNGQRDGPSASLYRPANPRRAHVRLGAVG